VTPPTEPTPFERFIGLITPDRFAGAAYGFAAVERDGEVENLACRVMLLERRVDDGWVTRGGIEALRLERGWIDFAQLCGFLKDAYHAKLELSGSCLLLTNNEGQPYYWGVQDFNPQIVEEIGWPGVRLVGQGRYIYQIAGRDEYRRLERRLMVAQPGPFDGWPAVGRYLAVEGSPLRLADSDSASLEIVAPSPLRLARGILHEDGVLQLVIQFRTEPIPKDFQLLLTDSEGDVLQTLGTRNGYQDEAPFVEFRVRLGKTVQAVNVSAYALGDTILKRRITRLDVDENSSATPRASRRRDTVSGAPSATAPLQARQVAQFLDQLHPQIRDRARAPLLNGQLDDAVSNAFKAIEVRLRELAHCSPDEIGTALVDKVLGPKKPRLQVGETSAEHQAAHSLFRGAIGWFKNPRSHRFTDLNHEIEAFEMIGFASQLMRMLDAARSVHPESS
jgi:uncharacterized protein (TIGR02391 family)